MLFNSIQFIIFFTIVVTVYFILPYRYRWIFLLASSCIFYMAWKPIYIILLLFSTVVNYICSLKIAANREKQNLYLGVALLSSLGILFIFKYLNFLSSSVNSIFSFIKIDYSFGTLDILLPMGISFYTFQTISYTIDVYKKKIKPEKAFLRLTLFITFFPQLVAGPIERFDRLMPQLFKKRKFNLKRTVEGIQIMMLGYFKKVVIADRLAIAVNTVYNSPNDYSSLALFIATIMFTFQIYCDFSGYSEIAIGAAKVLGIKLIENFERPYFSTSIKDFWRRWHISLSSWFRDYIYIPLGGNKKGVLRKYLNIMITFLASGLWHGASWNFIFWGGLHGLYQIVGDETLRLRKEIKRYLRIDGKLISKLIQISTTFFLICFAWIFFRANTISDGLYIASNLFNGISEWFKIRYVYDTVTNMGLTLFEFILVTISVLALILYEILSRNIALYKRLNSGNVVIRILFYLLLTVTILTMGVYHDASQFIYFQF